MAAGELTRILVHTDVTRYLEFKQISGSYVYKGGKVSKVPSNETEAVATPLIGMFEKYRLKKFLGWVAGYKEGEPSTQQGGSGTRIYLNLTPLGLRRTHARVDALASHPNPEQA